MESAITAWNAFEERTCRYWHRMSARPVWGPVFRVASRLGNGVIWYVLMVTLAVVGGTAGAATAILMGVTGIACTGIYKAVKTRIRRPRPCHVLPGLSARAPPLDRFSFPSGHTMHAFAFTIIACQAFPVLAWVLVPFTALVALSRLVLGLHYASDVVAGALLGTSLAALALTLVVHA